MCLMTSETSLTRSDQVLEILTKEILIGQYRAGERLPSERELAARFETNRGTIREALKKLEQLGIASVQPGGTRVLPVGEATLDVIGALLDLHGTPSPGLVADMIETLGTLTVLAVRKTVERASDSELEELRAEIEFMFTEQQNVGLFMDIFTGLCRRFMRTSGNLVLRLISNSLHMQFVNRERPTPAQIEINEEISERLIEGFRKRMPNAVAEAWHDLMQTTGQQIIEAAHHANQSVATV